MFLKIQDKVVTNFVWKSIARQACHSGLRVHLVTFYCAECCGLKPHITPPPPSLCVTSKLLSIMLVSKIFFKKYVFEIVIYYETSIIFITLLIPLYRFECTSISVYMNPNSKRKKIHNTYLYQNPFISLVTSCADIRFLYIGGS